MRRCFDRSDYSVAIKLGKPQNSWRWEINCAGKSIPVERSPVHFPTMGAASGKRSPQAVLLQVLWGIAHANSLVAPAGFWLARLLLWMDRVAPPPQLSFGVTQNAPSGRRPARSVHPKSDRSRLGLQSVGATVHARRRVAFGRDICPRGFGTHTLHTVNRRPFLR
jgi:hypothetical protein